MAVSIQQRDLDMVTILDLNGKLSGDATETLTTRVDELIEQGRRQLILNLGGVSFIDSAALGGLLSQRSEVRKSGGQLKLLNLSERITDLLVTTKLETVFDTYESEQEALSSFS